MSAGLVSPLAPMFSARKPPLPKPEHVVGLADDLESALVSAGWTAAVSHSVN